MSSEGTVEGKEISEYERGLVHFCSGLAHILLVGVRNIGTLYSLATHICVPGG